MTILNNFSIIYSLACSVVSCISYLPCDDGIDRQINIFMSLLCYFLQELVLNRTELIVNVLSGLCFPRLHLNNFCHFMNFLGIIPFLTSSWILLFFKVENISTAFTHREQPIIYYINRCQTLSHKLDLAPAERLSCWAAWNSKLCSQLILLANLVTKSRWAATFQKAFERRSAGKIRRGKVEW